MCSTIPGRRPAAPTSPPRFGVSLFKRPPGPTDPAACGPAREAGARRCGGSGLRAGADPSRSDARRAVPAPIPGTCRGRCDMPALQHQH